MFLTGYLVWGWPGVAWWLRRYQSDGPGIDSRWCHWIFQWHISFRPHHGPGVDSAPSENEYQEHFLEVKAAGARGWPHHLHVPNVMEIWKPKPPGTLWATPGLLRDCFTFILYEAHLVCACVRVLTRLRVPGCHNINCRKIHALLEVLLYRSLSFLEQTKR
jgi:hypothetical protein